MNITRLMENQETLTRRLSEIETIISSIEQAPSQEAFRSITMLLNEFEVMSNFFNRVDITQRFHSLKSRALNVAVEQNGLLLRAVNPDPFEVPEIRDFITKGVFACDKCSKQEIVVRISNIGRPIKTIYRCMSCQHTQLHMILPHMIAPIIKNGREIKLDYAVKK